LLSSSPAFRLLLFGSSISMLGTRISTVAFPMLVLHLNKSPFIAGLVTFAAIAPSVMAYVPAGVLVDRWNPRRVMLASESLRGLIIVSVVIGLVISRMHVRIWYLIIAMVLEEILEIFSTLAERRYLSRVIERDKIVSQQSSIEVRAHAVVLAGRPVGPFLFSIEPFLPFLADAASFIASVTSLLLIRRVDEPQVQARRLLLSEVRSDIRQGFRWLADDRRALLTLFLMAGTSMVAQALILMFLDEAHSKQLSTVAIGIVLAASGAGGAVGSFGSRFVPEVARNSWLTIELIAWSLALFFLSLAGGKSVYLGAGAMFILGLTGAIGNVEFGTYLVRNVADDMIAKVAGIGQMLAIGACAVGPVLGGYAIQRFQVQGAIFILLVIVAFLAFASWLFLDVSQQVTRSGKVIQKLVRDGEHAMRPETVTLDPAPVSSSAANHPDGNRNNRQKVVAFGDRMSLVPDNGRPSSCIDVSILTCEDAGS
jgi:MFS family permease